MSPPVSILGGLAGVAWLAQGLQVILIALATML